MYLDWSQLMTRDSQWEFSLRPSDVSRIYVGKEPTDNPQLLERADKLGKWLTNFPLFPFKLLRCSVQCFGRTSGRCSLLRSKKFLLEPKLSFPNEESPRLFVKKVPLISLAAVSLGTWLPLCLVITERKLIMKFFFQTSWNFLPCEVTEDDSHAHVTVGLTPAIELSSILNLFLQARHLHGNNM